jgi:hypothetical protein
MLSGDLGRLNAKTAPMNSRGDTSADNPARAVVPSVDSATEGERAPQAGAHTDDSNDAVSQWTEVTGAAPCPICGAFTGCRIHGSGRAAACRNAPDKEAHAHTGKDGHIYYIFEGDVFERRAFRRPQATYHPGTPPGPVHARPNEQAAAQSDGSVSRYLDLEHGLKIGPGAKGLCPFCRHDTFSVRRDDSLGKCFHPACGKYVSQASLSTGYAYSLSEVLDKIKNDCHQHLLAQEKSPLRLGYAWDWLTKERDVHPDVARDLPELGAVPQGYDIAAAFQPALNAVLAAEKELTAKINESRQRRLDAKQARRKQHEAGAQKSPASAKSRTEQEQAWERRLQRVVRDRECLQSQYETLRERLSQAAGWVAFFHTDASHRVIAIRFRKPYEKVFTQFAPYPKRGGLFGHSLFKPFSAAKSANNRLIILEGEMNLLQVHSLAVRNAPRPATEAPPRATGVASAYANWVAAVGSASAPDLEEIAKLLASPDEADPVPVIIQDHDEAGDAMVMRVLDRFTIDAVKPPTPGSDVDDFIRSFGREHAKAQDALVELIRRRKRLYRPFKALADQIYLTRQKHGEADNRRVFEIHKAVADIILADLRLRGRIYKQGQQGYYFFHDGKKLIALDDHDSELSILLSHYGLNPSEDIHEYIAKSLWLESLKEGQESRVHRLCWYDAKTFTLYVFNHDAGVYRVTVEGIDLVDNGADGVLFLTNRRNEPFAVADGEITGDPFHELVTAKINFAPQGRLTLQEQQAVFNLWVLCTFFGSVMPTKALLAFIGPKGSGKSHVLRKLGILLFGSKFEVKNLPATEGDFDAITTNTHFAAFDNADSYVKWLPDRLAICATGGTVSKRLLYTTNTLVEYPIDCFVGITSRKPYFRRDDVADRMLVNHVRRFGDGDFVAESELLAEILGKRNVVMTAVLRQAQVAIAALKATEGRTYRTTFRMADFATFALRLADANGRRKVIEELLDKLGEEQAVFALEGDSLVEVLVLWLGEPGNQGRLTDAGTLHKELRLLAEQRRLEFAYKSGHSLSKRLVNVEHNLKTVVRMEVAEDRHRKVNLYRFWPLESVAGPPSCG